MADLLTIAGVSKRFGPIPVLHDVTLRVPRRSIVGLVGENGAGKSTLFNIATGVTRADAGSMTLDGRPYVPRSYADAFALGVGRVFQEQALIGNVPVYANLLLSQEHRFTRFGQWLDKRAMIAAAETIVAEAGIDVDVRRPTHSYDFSKRQAIEIARACVAPRQILGLAETVTLLDEPTSALDREDETTFFALLTRLKQSGSFVFVSHRLTEIQALCDVIYVMRDGRLSPPLTPGEADEKTVHGLMVGRSRADDYYHLGRQTAVSDAPALFRVENLSGPGFRDVSLQVRPGEIVGIGGLLDSGKTALGKAMTGVTRPQAGTVSLGGAPGEVPTIDRLIPRGVGYVPAERLVEGIVASLPIAINLTLPSADRFSRRGLWRLKAERRAAVDAIGRMGVRSGTPAMPMRNLSGGNQQKVVLARWLQRDLKLLVLDNPTRGVDAGAKEEIYGHLRALAASGAGIVLITDELTELIGLSNRVIVMQRGRMVVDLPAPPEAKPTEHELIAHMLPRAA